MKCMILFLSGLVFFSAGAAADSSITTEAQPILQFSEDHLADRYDVLIDELRCPKCQNQNLADSDAPIAKDLRGELFRLLEEGNSNDEILEFMTLRYGEFVRYRPELTVYTLALWLVPIAVLLSGLIFWMIRTNRFRQKMASSPTEVPPDNSDQTTDTVDSNRTAAAVERQAKIDALLGAMKDD